MSPNEESPRPKSERPSGSRGTRTHNGTPSRTCFRGRLLIRSDDFRDLSNCGDRNLSGATTVKSHLPHNRLTVAIPPFAPQFAIHRANLDDEPINEKARCPACDTGLLRREKPVADVTCAGETRHPHGANSHVPNGWPSHWKTAAVPGDGRVAPRADSPRNSNPWDSNAGQQTASRRSDRIGTSAENES
jgi:hypothetical protein